MTTTKRQRNSPAAGVLGAVLLSAGLVGGCAFKNEEAPEPPKKVDIVDTLQREQDRQARDSVLSEQNVAVTFEELPDPGSYMMVVTWPASVKRMRVEVDGADPHIVIGQNWYREAVAGDSQIKILLESQDGLGASASILSLKAKAPKDLAIRELEKASAPKTYQGNRIFFLPNGRIDANGHSVTIIANKLIFNSGDIPKELPFQNQAQITSQVLGKKFEGDTVSPKQYISIKSKQAIGTLRIAMVGINGADGLSGDQVEALTRAKDPTRFTRLPPPDKKGPDGEDGISKEVPVQCSPAQARRGECPEAKVACAKPPTNGGRGLKGAKGVTGGTSHDGGDTGDIYVDIEEHSQLNLIVGQLPGRPGKPGVGGKGFPGGPGGKPGAAPHPCPAASEGPQGEAGETGDSGIQGKLGEAGKVDTGYIKPVRAAFE